MKILFIFTLVLGILTVGFLFSNKSGENDKLISPKVQASTPKASEVRSLEGTMKLLMTSKENPDKTLTYFFTVSDPSGKTTPIFSKTATSGEAMALSHNSWSPNNKYLFIEDRFSTFTDYLVFKVNGEPFTNGEKYLNATNLFKEKVKNYNLKAITGWDDPVLVHVQTVKGPPFWFDLTTQSFIQLVR